MFMLSGVMPFDDSDIRSTFNQRVRSDDLIRARLKHRGLGDAIDRVLFAALRADPNARSSSPLAFSEEVRAALGVGPAVLPPSALAPRKAAESLTLETSVLRKNGQPETTLPKETRITIGKFHVRLVEISEMLEFTQDRPSPYGPAEIRFRVTMLPSPTGPLRINLKGLNCFVARSGGRPTPAIVASEETGDSSLDLISATREQLGAVSWSFGTKTHDGRLFVVDDEELVVPYREASHAVMLHLGEDRELIVMCRRT